MKTIKSILFSALLFTALSCNRDENDSTSLDTDALVAKANTDYAMDLDFSTGLEVASNNSSYSSRSSNSISLIPSCATITVNNTTPGVFPKIFTINYGTGCTMNGVTRAGIITITLSDYVLNNGSTLTIERGINYYVNAKKVEGTVVYTNQTTNSNTPEWSRSVTNGKITFPDGRFFIHNGTHVTRQTSGASTLILTDNIYEIISGTGTVVRSNGTQLTATVITPLVKEFTCANISDGQLNLIGTVLNGVLDYGNGTCDNQATYTHSNGQVYTITLN